MANKQLLATRCLRISQKADDARCGNEPHHLICRIKLETTPGKVQRIRLCMKAVLVKLSHDKEIYGQDVFGIGPSYNSDLCGRIYVPPSSR